MASATYGARDGFRARFHLHSQSSDQDLKVAIKLAKRQQESLVGGRTVRRNEEEIRKTPYSISRHNVTGGRPRKRPAPVPVPSRGFQDDVISRVNARYSFSSLDGKHEALLGPTLEVAAAVPSIPRKPVATDPEVLDLLSAQSVLHDVHCQSSPEEAAQGKTQTGLNGADPSAPSGPKKGGKLSQKELEAKAKKARKIVKADIKEKEKKTRKTLKAKFKTASSNPEGFVAWAEAYQRLATMPDERTALWPVPELREDTPKPSSMRWLKALIPKRLKEWSSPTDLHSVTAQSTSAEGTRTRIDAAPEETWLQSELPVNEIIRTGPGNRAELDASEHGYPLVPHQPAKNADSRSAHRLNALDAPFQDAPDCLPWPDDVPGSSPQALTAPTSGSQSLAGNENAEMMVRYLDGEKKFIRDEISRLGAQAAAKLKQCATVMEQAESSRNAVLSRTLSEQHRRHAQELEKFTRALSTLQQKVPQETEEGAHQEHEPPGEVSGTPERIFAPRNQDLALQLREASLREKEAVLREREAASREREAASRERQAVSLMAEPRSQAKQSAWQRRIRLSDNELRYSRGTVSPSETLDPEPYDMTPGKGLSPTSNRHKSAGEAEGHRSSSRISQVARLPLRAARNSFESPKARGQVNTNTSSGHQMRRALHRMTRTVEDRFVAGVLPFRGVGFRAHAVPKRKSAGSATFVKSSGQPRQQLGHCARRRVDKGKGKELSDDEEDSDAEPRKRRRRNPPMPNSQQRILACPYSKYDICRYSETNVTEKCYRGCSSCFLSDISRLKQHLYRVHCRPESHCPRCFEVFASDVLLDEHTRQLISCKVATCPFPEKLTDGQVKQLRKKGHGKSMEERWYIIFRILFPTAPRPPSPYADDKSSVLVQLEAQTAPERLSRLFRERMSQLECTPVTAQLWVDEIQTMLARVVEDSMVELLRHNMFSHVPGSDPSSANSSDSLSSLIQQSQAVQSDDPQMTPHFQGNQGLASCAASPNTCLPSLLDFELGFPEFEDGAFEDLLALGNGQLDDSGHSTDPSVWSRMPQAQSSQGDVSPLSPWEDNISPFSQWEEDISVLSPRETVEAGASVAPNLASDAALADTKAVQATWDDHSSETMHQIPGTSLSSALPISESASPILTLPQDLGPMRPPPTRRTTQPDPEPLVAAVQPQPVLHSKRSQRSLDSGYGSLLTAEQSNTSSDDSGSTTMQGFNNTGFADTLAECWGPVNADEQAFWEQATRSTAL